MKLTNKPKRPQTIEEVCGKPPGSFAAFIKQQSEAMRREEEERKARIRASRT